MARRLPGEAADADAVGALPPGSARRATRPRPARAALGRDSRWRSAPLRATSARARVSSAAQPSRSAAGSSSSSSARRRSRVGTRVAGARSASSPSTPWRHADQRFSSIRHVGARAGPRRRRGARRGGRRARGRRRRSPRRRRPSPARRARGPRACRSARCSRSSHHHWRGVGDRAGGRAPAQRVGERLPARERGRDALARQQAARATGGPRPGRCRGRRRNGALARQRGELGQVLAQRVVDRERAVGARTATWTCRPQTSWRRATGPYSRRVRVVARRRG